MRLIHAAAKKISVSGGTSRTAVRGRTRDRDRERRGRGPRGRARKLPLTARPTRQPPGRQPAGPHRKCRALPQVARAHRAQACPHRAPHSPPLQHAGPRCQKFKNGCCTPPTARSIRCSMANFRCIIASRESARNTLIWRPNRIDSQANSASNSGRIGFAAEFLNRTDPTQWGEKSPKPTSTKS